MFPEKMLNLGKKRSVIRELFEYGKIRKEQIGAENVFDFSLGNPSVAPPDCVNETIIDLVKNTSNIELHGYTSAQGDATVRSAVSDYINKNFGTHLTPNHIYMTVGAAASLTITIHALCEENDEFVVFAPFFPEYRVFVENAGAKLIINRLTSDQFDIDFDALERSLTPQTKAVILNSPNNPSGVVIKKASIERLCAVLKQKEQQYGHPIFLISDEPYRELVYDDIEVPYLMNYYDNTIVCYSFSKSLSLPGERIGYIAVCDRCTQEQDLYAAICGAGRALGYVCAPSLFQRVAANCLGSTSDISAYRKNRDLLYQSLCQYGYHCIRPDGAFYLFVRALESDAGKFCERAKKHELLLVPSDDFGYPGFVRISYCVSYEQIERSLPAFKSLAEEYANQ